MEQRYIPFNQIETRNTENGNPVIEGMFIVYDDVYELFDGATESIARGAFTQALNGDIRALYNHNTDIVLGRTTAGTLELRETDEGLWGRVTIDPEDTDAMNVYRRIARGSVTGCSFGFEIEDEERSVKDDGTVHWTITKINPIYEVSPVCLPAYKATSISARQKEFDTINAEAQTRKAEVWKEQMKRRIKDGSESTHAEEKD